MKVWNIGGNNAEKFARADRITNSKFYWAGRTILTLSIYAQQRWIENVAFGLKKERRARVENF